MELIPELYRVPQAHHHSTHIQLILALRVMLYLDSQVLEVSSHPTQAFCYGDLVNSFCGPTLWEDHCFVFVYLESRCQTKLPHDSQQASYGYGGVCYIHKGIICI